MVDGIGPRQAQDRALRHLAERPLVRGRLRQGFRGRSGGPRLGSRQSLALRIRLRRLALLERAQPRIEIGDQLVDAPLDLAPAELQLLDPAGQAPQLLLELQEPDLEPGPLLRIVDLRRQHLAHVRELDPQPVDIARHDAGIGGSGRAPEQQHRDADGKPAPGLPGLRPALGCVAALHRLVVSPSSSVRRHCVVVTVVTARRFSVQACSS